MGDPEELVFVYGTLRKGASNHFRMEGAELVGRGMMWGKLYRIDWYPGMVPGPDGEMVFGEVYRVEAETLARLDAFEGFVGGEDDEFRRIRGVVTFDDDQPDAEVWIYEYIGPREGKTRVTPADWTPPEDRPPIFGSLAVVLLFVSTFVLMQVEEIAQQLVLGVELRLALQAGSAVMLTLPFFAGWGAIRRMERYRFWTETCMLVALGVFAFWGVPVLVRVFIELRAMI